MAEGDEQDQEQKTEQPTPKRLEEALKKGNVPTSREVNNLLILVALAMTVAWFAPHILREGKLLLAPFITSFETIPTDSKHIGKLFTHVFFGGMAVIVAPLLASIIAAVLASLIQHGFVFSGEPIIPKWQKISPMEGIKRLFSLRSVVEFVKGIFKILIIGVVAFIAVYPEMAHLKQLPNSSLEAILLFIGMLAIRMTIGVAIAMFFIALLDLLYQRWQHTKSLRMSVQEIKDEYKQSEGDPVIKQRLRRLRQERAKNRMMAAVPKADVVITNPTHFAIALEYQAGEMKAPTVVAKGQDLIALRIRDIAEENDVPIVENPPLARALFDSTDLNEEIPVAQYEAVAKVISYVYGLKGKKLL